MRVAILAVAVLAAACGQVSVSADGDRGHAGGYTMEVRADQGEEVYLVTAPDGRIAAARAAQGASTLLRGRAVQALANQPMPAPDGDAQVAFKVPGLDVQVQGDDPDGAGDSENAHVTVNAGGQHIEVNAQENGPGDADDRAHVRITGADEEAARNFINEQDDLSAEVKTQMLAELGLSEDR